MSNTDKKVIDNNIASSNNKTTYNNNFNCFSQPTIKESKISFPSKSTKTFTINSPTKSYKSNINQKKDNATIQSNYKSNIYNTKLDSSKFSVSDSINYLKLGLANKETNNNEKSKEYFQKAILLINKKLTNIEECTKKLKDDNKRDKSKDDKITSLNAKKDLVIECYSMFERIKNNAVIKSLSINNNNIINNNNNSNSNSNKNSRKNSFDSPIKKNNNNVMYNVLNSIELNIKHKDATTATKSYIKKELLLFENLIQSIEKGCYLTSNLFLRKEIFNQSNAKINYLNQKYDAIYLIYNKIDNLITLEEKKVINFSNLERFVDVLVDIQNSFSKEIEAFTAINNYVMGKEILNNSFYKKFSDFTAKLRSSLISSKLEDKPDYFDIYIKLINKLYSLDNIYNYFENNFKKLESSVKLNLLYEKINIINKFLYNFLYKLFIIDTKELASRFIKKKILSFEEK